MLQKRCKNCIFLSVSKRFQDGKLRRKTGCVLKFLLDADSQHTAALVQASSVNEIIRGGKNLGFVYKFLGF